MAINPTPEQIKTLVDGPADTPVVMLNLLKFADRASGDAGEQGMSGRASYGKYGDGVRKLLEAKGGRVLWQGKADSVVIGSDADDWDTVILVEYPSRQAFLEMTSSKEYREVGKSRTSALADSRLIAMTEQFRLTD
jgi:uncharacterized protein (DUF1330 family)